MPEPLIIPNRREYVLMSDGTIVRRSIQEIAIEPADDMIKRLSVDTTLRVPNFGHIKDVGTISLRVCSVCTYVKVDLERLMIRAPWRALDTKPVHLIPVFNSSTDPVMTMCFKPHQGMSISFMIAATTNGAKWSLAGNWLFAHDGKQCYRMPLANVHDDCSCCTGMREPLCRDTLSELITASIKNFDEASYNGDLWKSSSETAAFFRMKPEGNSFSSIQNKDWKDYCIKVGSVISEMAI